ncbi:glycosyltransferase family 2 protein [Sphingobacterium deserti]|uniref:Family 2 glycosyl transferase n=1 Tax=Sphingobacterium deserti TaxID=1229276 RepID=A0A0B8T3R1_9SPHI|nr:glycosyltransferase family A protein [Sphingobacterium deserti]KGE16212.1 family 2 glycosyl transferase [Sphingobacterium deserti]
MAVTLIAYLFIFFILQFAVAAYNYYRKPLLPHCTKSSKAKISILIPARNEARSLPFLLESLKQQSYPDFEIIILDDESNDGTAEIALQYANSFDNFTVIKGKPLPAGWTGKNFACAQLAEKASGDYLLFLDADIVTRPQLLASLAQAMSHDKLTLLSIVPQQQLMTLGEKVSVPLMNHMLLTLLPLPLVSEHEMPVFAAACGQVMCFNAHKYHTYQFHERVRTEIVEDLCIMRTVKQLSQKGKTLMGNKLVGCRMYKGYLEAVNGFGKNFLGPFNDKIALFLTYMLPMVFGPLLVWCLTGTIGFLTLCAILFGTRILTSLLANEDVLTNVVLLPITLFNLFIIGSTAIYIHLSGRGKWKGRTIRKAPVLRYPSDGKLSA